MLAKFPSTLTIVNRSSSTLYENRGSDDDSVELDADCFRVVTTSIKDKDTTVSTSEAKVGYSKMSLKDGLRYKIQERRKSTGAGDIEIKFEPPKEYPLTREEKRKQDFRRQRNRDSANRSRLKRKFKLEYLEKEVNNLKKENNELTVNIATLKNVKKTLMTNLDTHECIFTGQDADGKCNVPNISCEYSQSIPCGQSGASMHQGPSTARIYRGSSGTKMASALSGSRMPIGLRRASFGPSMSSMRLGAIGASISSGPSRASMPKETSGSHIFIGSSGTSMSSGNSGTCM